MGVSTGSAPGGLSGLAVRAVVWQAVSFASARVLSLAATVVLARLLTPGQFGLVGFALVFVTFAEYVTDLGVAQALVYHRRDDRLADAAAAVCAASGVVLAVVGLAAAGAVAAFFGSAAVAPMVRVLSISLVVSALRQVPIALLRRELAFRRLLVTELARAVVQGGLSIALAAAGVGAWAIVWGYVAGGAACTVAAYATAGYRARAPRGLTPSVIRPLLAYGVPAAGQALLAALIFDVDYVIVGRVLGSPALGVYTLAFRVPQVVIIGVFVILSSVAFPAFSRARADPARLRRGYLAAMRLQTAYGVAAGVGLCMVAPMLVAVVFGPRWTAAVVPLEALALYAAGRSLGTGAVDVYKGIGRPGIGLGVTLVRLAVLVPALLLAAHQGGVDAVAWTQAGLALAFAAGMQAVAARVVGVGAAELARTVRPAAALAAGIAVGGGAVRWGLGGPEALRLAVAIPAGAACGLVALWRADADFVRESLAMLAAGRGRSARAA